MAGALALVFVTVFVGVILERLFYQAYLWGHRASADASEYAKARAFARTSAIQVVLVVGLCAIAVYFHLWRLF